MKKNLTKLKQAKIILLEGKYKRLTYYINGRTDWAFEGTKLEYQSGLIDRTSLIRFAKKIKDKRDKMSYLFEKNKVTSFKEQLRRRKISSTKIKNKIIGD